MSMGDYFSSVNITKKMSMGDYFSSVNITIFYTKVYPIEGSRVTYDMRCVICVYRRKW